MRYMTNELKERHLTRHGIGTSRSARELFTAYFYAGSGWVVQLLVWRYDNNDNVVDGERKTKLEDQGVELGEYRT